MSEVKTMSSIQFPNTQQPYQVNDARIPADPGAYKYMATDGEGNWVPVDRLAWKESKVESKTLYHFTETAPLPGYVIMRPYNMIPDCVVGNTYHVECPQLGVDDDVVCDSFELKSPRLLIEGKLSIYYDFMESGTSFLNKAGNYEADKSYDFIISEQAEVETIHPIPAEYITGAPLTGDDWGKVLAVGEDEYGLALVFSPKTIRFDIYSHGCSCNLGYNEFMAATENGTPIVVNDLTDSGGTIIRSVFKIQIADYGETTYLTVYDEQTRNELYRYKFTVDGIVSETTSPT